MIDDRFKFRVWSNKYEKMLYTDNINSAKEIKHYIALWNGAWDLMITDEHFYNIDTYWKSKAYNFHENNDVLMQCSGLYDNDDNLIFEGDLIEFIEEPKDYYGCFFDSDVACFVFSRINEQIGHGIEVFGGMKFKVIGNIYENPELLK